MRQGPNIAAVAHLIGDPARANMVTALMDGRALTAGELAAVGGVTPATASGHLAKLGDAGLLTAERQGRHRYFRLSGGDVAELVETLMCVSERLRPARVQTGPRDAALRDVRVCYDHLAGARAVALHAAWVDRGWIEEAGALRLTATGHAGLASVGTDSVALSAGRPLYRPCLDWSERRPHLGGALGAAVLRLVLDRGWATRGPGRVLRFTGAGEKAWADLLVAPQSAPAVAA